MRQQLLMLFMNILETVAYSYICKRFKCKYNSDIEMFVMEQNFGAECFYFFKKESWEQKVHVVEKVKKDDYLA